MYRNNGRNIAVRLFALRDYLYANADKTHAVKVEDILIFYRNKGFTDNNIKMVYSDLHTLQSDELGIDIAYEEKAKGWILYNPPFKAHELRLIVDSVQASKFITQSKARSLTEKINKNFGSGRRQNLNRQAYVYDRIRSQNDNVVAQTDNLHEAITANRKISFKYFHYSPDRRNPKTYSNSGEKIVVSPFALYWSNGNLYLYAFDGKIMRFYRVDRMEHISKPLPEIREGHDLFDSKSLTRQKAKVFDMYSTGKVYKVKMRFRNELTDQVIDQFGKDIMTTRTDDEHFTINADVDLSSPFYAWVATFGRRAKIISPPEAVKGMRDFIKKVSDMYKDDGNT